MKCRWLCQSSVHEENDENFVHIDQDTSKYPSPWERPAPEFQRKKCLDTITKFKNVFSYKIIEEKMEINTLTEVK